MKEIHIHRISIQFESKNKKNEKRERKIMKDGKQFREYKI